MNFRAYINQMLNLAEETQQASFSFDQNPFDESCKFDLMFHEDSYVSLFDLFGQETSVEQPVYDQGTALTAGTEIAEMDEDKLIITINGEVINDVQEHAEIRAILKEKHWNKIKCYRNLQDPNFLMAPRK